MSLTTTHQTPYTRSRASVATTTRPRTAASTPTRPKTAGSVMTRVNSAPKMSISNAINVNTSIRPNSGKGNTEGLGDRKFSGIRSLKSVVNEQKSTVSVYKRIESKPIGELDKVLYQTSWIL